MTRRTVWVLLLIASLGAGDVAAEDARPARTRRGRRPVAKNVILFVGDGMGVSTVTAARILAGGASGALTLDQLPYTALSRTYSLSHQVADSAAGMNALTTGIKTANGVIAMDAATERNDANKDGDGASVQTILELARAARKSTGIVTTTHVTHATPAACYAHVNDRDKELEIAAQLVPRGAGYNSALGKGVDVILGGGRRYFLPVTDADGDAVHDEEGALGARDDGRNLIAEMQKAGYTYVWNAQQFAALDMKKTKRLLGLFESSHMLFDFQRPTDAAGEPGLADLTETAIALLARNRRGYFLMVEGGRIDHGHHGNSAFAALTETLAFDRAIARALELVDLKDTLVIVTADHSHVLTIAGYPERGTSIFGIAGRDRQGVPYTTLLYANGPGHRGPMGRVPPDRDEFSGVLESPAPKDPTHPTYVQEAGIPLNSETHAGEDVIIWATGSGAEHVRGVVENTRVFAWMRAATGL